MTNILALIVISLAIAMTGFATVFLLWVAGYLALYEHHTYYIVPLWCVLAALWYAKQFYKAVVVIWHEWTEHS